MTEANTRIKSKGNGRYARECRACHNEKARARGRKQRGFYPREIGPDGNPVPRKKTTKSILGSTAFGNDCFSHAQIMAFRRSE